MKKILKYKKLFSVTLCLCMLICISSCSAEKDNASATNQTEKATPESVSEIEVYAGPGNDYMLLNKISKNNITEYVKIENGWIEVEYDNKRGYINEDNVNDIDVNEIPHVVYQINQNVLPYPTVYNVKFEKILFDDAKVYYAPKASGTPTIINKNEDVTILCSESSALKNYVQIEFDTKKGKRRGYCESTDLLSLDNPLLNFEEVKQKNAIISYDGNQYYSSSGEAGSLSNDWSKKDEKSIKKVDVNWIAGITGVIAGNDINDEAVESTEGRLQLYDSKKRKYINANTSDSKISDKLDIADFIVSSAISFIESGVEITDLNVRMDEYNGEKRIVIKTGTPIEFSKAGKETDLNTLIVEKNNTALTLVESQKKADEMIKNMYPNLDKNKTYSMRMTFSDEFKDNNYGYYIVIDNKCNVYAVPIIHNGTSFKVFSEGKFICDAAWDMSASMIKIDDKSADRILSILSENGFIIDGYEKEYNENQISDELYSSADKYKYLDEVPIKEYDQYSDNEGDSFVYPIDKHQFTRGNTDINGNTYEHGIEGWIARWNYAEETSWAYSVFDLSGKYKKISGNCVLIDSANTDNFDTTLEFIGDGNVIKKYHLKPDEIPFEIDIDVTGVENLKIYFYDNVSKKSGTSFGLVEMKLS